MTVVIVASLLPDRSLPLRALARLNISDKIQHFVAYAVLAFVPALHERPRAVGAIAVGLIGLGVLLEFMQLLAARDFEIVDMAADAVGVFVGIAAAWPLRRFLKRQSQILTCGCSDRFGLPSSRAGMRYPPLVIAWQRRASEHTP